jgi:hypothetical protein
MYTNTPGSNNLLFFRHESKNLLFFRLVRKNESYLFFSFFIKYFFRKTEIFKLIWYSFDNLNRAHCKLNQKKFSIFLTFSAENPIFSAFFRNQYIAQIKSSLEYITINYSKCLIMKLLDKH